MSRRATGRPALNNAILRRHRSLTMALAGLIAIAVVVQALALASGLADGLATRDWDVALTAAAVVVGAVALRGMVGWIAEVRGRRAGSEAMAELRQQVVDSAMNAAPAGRGDGALGGDIAAVTVQGGAAVEQWAGKVLVQQALAVTVPIAALIAIAWMDWISAVILIPTLPLLIVFLVLVGGDARRASESRLAAMRLLGGHMLDVLRGLPTLRSFGRARRQCDELNRVGDAYRRETIAILRSAFTSAFVLEFIAMLGTALVAVVAGVRLVNGSMQFEVAMAVLLLAPELYLPLRAMGTEYHAAAEARATLARVEQATAGTVPMPAGAPGGPSPSPADGPVEVRDLVVAPREGDPVLSGVSLTVETGSVIALVGPSGAGKTTLLRIILGLQAPHGGGVFCCGRDLEDMDLADWRRHIAWIPQSPMVLADTLRENLLVARPDADTEQLWNALSVARLDGWARELPGQLDEYLGDGGVPISAGERRRLGIARAVLRDAPLVLADEPTANLDSVTADLVCEALGDLLRGRSAIVVTHRSDVVALCDVTVELRHGRLRSDQRAVGVS